MTVGFQSILTYLTTPSESAEIVECSARLARETGARLKLASVLKPLPVYLRAPNYGYPALSETVEKELRAELEALAAPLRESGLKVDIEALTGKPHEEVIRETIRAGHDLVITPAPAKGTLTRSASTAARLCRLSPAPVWSISGDGTTPFQRILATVDPLSNDEAGNELNQRVIETALEAARLEDGEVFVLFVWGEDLPPASLEAHGDDIRKLAESALKSLLEPYAEEIATENVFLEFGDPAPTIERIAEEQEIDLVVMGTIARSGVKAIWIGNTAERLLAELDMSVLAVKPAGFISPLDPSA